MKTRRQNSMSDNLGLLLDAICNTFGAVLLIAILIAVLLNTSAKNVLPTEKDVAQIKEIRELENARLLLEAKKKELEIILNATEAVPESVRTDNEEQIKLIAIIEVIRDQISDHENELEAKNEESRQRREVAGEQQSKQAELETQINDLLREIELEEKSRTEVAKLPVLKSDSKNQVAILLRYDRLYLTHTYDGNGNRGPINTKDMLIVKSIDEDGKPITEARAKPTAGIDLTAKNAKVKIKALMQIFKPQRESIIIFAGPGSFDNYQIVAAILTQLRFNIFPWPIGDGVWDQGGSSTPTQ